MNSLPLFLTLGIYWKNFQGSPKLVEAYLWRAPAKPRPPIPPPTITMSSWCTLLVPLPKHLVPIIGGRRREVPITLCSWIRPNKSKVHQAELMKGEPRSGCCWQKEQFHRDSVQCKWAMRALVLRVNLRAAAFQLGSSTIAKPSKRGVSFKHIAVIQSTQPHSRQPFRVNADFANDFLSVND